MKLYNKVAGAKIRNQFDCGGITHMVGSSLFSPDALRRSVATTAIHSSRDRSDILYHDSCIAPIVQRFSDSANAKIFIIIAKKIVTVASRLPVKSKTTIQRRLRTVVARILLPGTVNRATLSREPIRSAALGSGSNIVHFHPILHS